MPKSWCSVLSLKMVKSVMKQNRTGHCITCTWKVIWSIMKQSKPSLALGITWTRQDVHNQAESDPGFHLVIVYQVKELMCANLVLEVLISCHLDDGVQMGLHLLLPSPLLLLSLGLPSATGPSQLQLCLSDSHLAAARCMSRQYLTNQHPQAWPCMQQQHASC